MERECSICKFPLKHYYRNADPLTDGICCEKCFQYKVIPAREAKIRQWNLEAATKLSNPEIAERKENATCPTGKIGYKKKEDAEYALYMCKKQQREGTSIRNEKHIYFCKLCQEFHLTSHDQLPNWRNRNKPTNYNYSRPAKYIPVARQENWG
jgi:hypothetical protein